MDVMKKKCSWLITPLVGGWMKLDGGAFFGTVPKVMWRRLVLPDRLNRICVPCRVLLAKRGKETVLIDTGYGEKYSASQRRALGLENGNPLFRALARADTEPGEITHVVMTHLHFDHAGGAVALNEKGVPVPAFPNARYWASSAEWDDAVEPIPALRKAYPQENLLPLLEKKVTESFEDGEEILPGLTMRVTGGHTRGHAAALIEASGGPVHFLGDLVPTRWHGKQLWTAAYDTHILDLRIRKPRFLSEAFQRNAAVWFPHDPLGAFSRIAEQTGANFQFESPER